MVVQIAYGVHVGAVSMLGQQYGCVTIVRLGQFPKEVSVDVFAVRVFLAIIEEAGILLLTKHCRHVL